LISCEEGVHLIDDYCSMKIPEGDVEKEHVAVVAQVEIEGRRGIMMMDPGYHVGRAVTVMVDGQFPHTGWFVQSQSAKAVKKYCYNFHSNESYVVWSVEDIRAGNSKVNTNLFFVSGEYVNAVDVTERRNLVYGFRSLLKRNPNGDLLGGVYFPLKAEASFTLFHVNGLGQREETKIPIVDIPFALNGQDEQTMYLCETALELPAGRLSAILIMLSRMLQDEEFLSQVQRIDHLIDSGATYH